MQWRWCVALAMFGLASCSQSTGDPNKPTRRGADRGACERSLEAGALRSTANRQACQGLWCFKNSNISFKCFSSEAQCDAGFRSQRPGFGGSGCQQMFQ